MLLILGGSAGILLFVLADVAELHGNPPLRLGAALLSSALYVGSFALLIALSHPLGIPIAARIASGVVAGFFAGLLALSLFFEVRLPGSFTRAPATPRPLVTTGTYALCRHPGVLWLFFAHLSIALAADARALLVALPFWTAADIVLALVEDRLLFPRLFGAAYGRYRSSTPFLVPGPQSIARWRAGAGWRSGEANDTTAKEMPHG